MSLKPQYIEISPNVSLEFPASMFFVDEDTLAKAVDLVKNVQSAEQLKAEARQMIFAGHLATLWAAEFMPEELVSAFFHNGPFITEIRCAFHRLDDAGSRFMLKMIKPAMGPATFDRLTRLRAFTELKKITPLTTKYRHSHTLRLDFCRDFGYIYPAAAELIKRERPMKNGTKTGYDLSQLPAKDRYAVEVFTGVIPQKDLSAKDAHDIYFA